jgi:hypothetical protein
MSSTIVNAAPLVIDRGTQDLSTRSVPRDPEAIPQHLPKYYLFAETGPEDDQLVVGADLINIYGAESFNITGKYANYSTPFITGSNAKGNACMLHRIVPPDSGPKANMVVCLDVLTCQVDDYERNIDGGIKLNPLTGEPIIVGTIPGHKVKWVVTSRNSSTDAANFGTASVLVGDQVDPTTSAQSQRFPIFELETSFKGRKGNDSGIRMWAPTTKTVSSLPTKMMNSQFAYPYNIAIIRRPDEKSSPKIVQSVFGEQSMTVTFKPSVIDPMTEKPLYIGDTLIDSYQNLQDLRYAKLYGDFSRMKVYEENIETVLGMFHTAEIPFIGSDTDFGADPKEKHLFNFVTGVDSSGTPYHSFVFVDGSNSVRFSEYQNIYAASGSDGTMSEDNYTAAVKADVARYLDPSDEYQELAVHVESIIYDTGFPIDTKMALASIIGQRKDTFVVLGTHTVNGPKMTASEEHSIAIALRTRLQMFPESDYFGTPVMRGMIMGRSGKIRNSQYTKPLPLTYEVMMKSAAYMGSSNGRWKNGFSFDSAPGSILEYMYDINITWVPASVRNRNWDIGLNWVQAYDRSSYMFPALKTIYDNDTSVLNSYFTAMAICTLNKVAHSAWREFTGTSSLSNAQLEKRVNEFVDKRVTGRFDERFIIRPDAYHTESDTLRGFSWTLPIKIYAQSMASVMTTYVQAYRMSDLEV